MGGAVAAAAESRFVSMPGPEDLGPLGAHLVGDGFGWCTGQVLFAGGSELAVVDEPRLLEVVRSDEVVSLARVLEAVIPRAFAKAEASQASDGGGNPRFGPIFDEPAPAEVAPAAGAILRRRHRPPAVGGVAHRRARGPVRHLPPRRGRPRLPPTPPTRCAPSSKPPGRSTPSSSRPPAGSRRPPRQKAGSGCSPSTAGSSRTSIPTPDGPGRPPTTPPKPARPVRLVTLTDAATTGGRSRAQASAQLARAAAGSTEGRVTAFAASIEAPEEAAGQPVGELVAHLLSHPEATALAGAELVVRRGLARPSQSPPTDRQPSPTAAPPSPIGSTPRSGRSSAPTAVHRPRRPDDRPAHPCRRRARAPLGPRPHRLVPLPRRVLRKTVPVMRRGCTAASMSTPIRPRRPRWNVEKFVNVAAATGRHSDRGDHRARYQRLMPAAVPTPSSAASRRPTRWLRPSSSSTGR